MTVTTLLDLSALGRSGYAYIVDVFVARLALQLGRLSGCTPALDHSEAPALALPRGTLRTLLSSAVTPFASIELWADPCTLGPVKALIINS